MQLLRYRGPDGEERRWTLKEIVQGKPLGHPSHAMLVHFPVAFYFGALAFDLMSRAGRFPQAPPAATWLIVGALAATIPAALTGLVDWWGMVPGSSKRRVATRHMLFQLGAAAVFAIDLGIRWSERHRPTAEWRWVALEVVGVVVLSAGQWLGGVLVYEMGMRVRTVRERRREVADQNAA